MGENLLHRSYMKKKLLNISISIILLISLFEIVGCNSIRNEKDIIDNTGEEITLQIQIWGDNYRKELTKETTELFRKTHPNVNFEVNLVKTSEYASVIAMNTANGDMPDIIQLGNLHNYAEKGLLEPFNDYIDRGIIDLSNIDVSNFEKAFINDDMYGLALGLNSDAVAANPLVFEEADVEIPKGRYNFDDLYELCKTLKKNIDRDDFYPLQTFFKFTIFARTKGARYYNQEGTALGYEDDQVFIDYFETYLKWLDEGIIAPIDLVKKRIKEESLICTGDAALYPKYTNGLSKYSDYAGYILDVIAMPSGDVGDEGSFVKPSMCFAVSSYSEHKDEAMEFINFFTNSIEANDILSGDRGIPVSKEVSNYVEEKLDDASKQQYSFFKYLDENPSKADPPKPVFKEGAEYVFSKYSDAILSGKITPREAAPLFRAEVNKILAKGMED